MAHKILIVEDNLYMQNMLVMILQEHGFVVDAVFDGADAIEILQKQDYAVTIVDMHLPDMNGLHLIDSIRDIIEDMPIIGISGGDTLKEGDMSVLHQAMKKGLSGVFKKPFSPEDLVTALHHVIDGPQNKEEKKGFLKFGR